MDHFPLRKIDTGLPTTKLDKCATGDRMTLVLSSNRSKQVGLESLSRAEGLGKPLDPNNGRESVVSCE